MNLTLSIERLNTQAPQKPDMDPEGKLKVFKVWRTIQGEGPHVGRPAIFMRLYGCNLMCPACDTDYTSNSELMTPNEVAWAVFNANIYGNTSLVVITGGEPFRQNITPALQLLNQYGYTTQIETNGIYFDEKYHYGLPLNGRLSVVCSPKTPNINEHLRPYVSSLKYVLDAENVSPTDGLPTHTLGMKAAPARPWDGYAGRIYLQPADVGNTYGNQRNLAAAVQSCMKYGYTLCLQIHKLIGVD